MVINCNLRICFVGHVCLIFFMHSECNCKCNVVCYIKSLWHPWSRAIFELTYINIQNLALIHAYRQGICMNNINQNMCTFMKAKPGRTYITIIIIGKNATSNSFGNIWCVKELTYVTVITSFLLQCSRCQFVIGSSSIMILIKCPT